MLAISIIFIFAQASNTLLIYASLVLFFSRPLGRGWPHNQKAGVFDVSSI